MSPLMDGRTDSEKYATGCRILENFIVRSYGGVSKRPGTRFGATNSHVTDCVRLIAFRRSTDINFVLGFKLNAIKVWSYSAGVFTLVTTLTTTYTEAEIADLHFCQLNDIMHLTVATKHPKIITRASDGTWSITDTPFQFAPALDPPNDAVTMKIDYDANDWVTLTSYAIGDFVLQGGLLYRCITANSDAVFTGAKWTVAIYDTPWNVGTAQVVGEVVEYFGSNYFCITAHTSSSANRPGVGAQWVLIPITDYRLTASSATFDANEIGSTWLLSPGSTNRIARETFGAGAGTFTSAAIFIQGTYRARTLWTALSAPTLTSLQLQESLDRINFTTVKEWRIETAQEGTISYTSEAPNTGGWYRFVAIRDTGAASALTDWMIIEPATAKLDIPFNVVSYVSTTQVRGIPRLAVDSLIPNEVIGSTFPVWRKGAFSTTRGFPRTVTFHDSRLFFASTATEPMRIWGSQTDDFYTFLTGSLDTSGIDVTLAATQANDIQWITSFKRTMVIGTTGEEWTMDSGDTDGALVPSNVRLRRWSRYGSSKHQPILSGDGLIWLTRDNRLREFAYVFEKDGYSAPEMTLLAEHIPSASFVVSVTYSQSPDPIVWLVHEDGSWSGFTYDRENNVTAWHRHASPGAGGEANDPCLSICTLYGSANDFSNAGDSLIFLFERFNGYTLESIDGTVMACAMSSGNIDFQGTPDSSNGVFLDSHVLVTGTPGSGITTFPVTSANPVLTAGRTVVLSNIGLPPLNADGSPLELVINGSGNVVATGTVLAIHAGLAYSAVLIPNRMEIQLRDGSAQMRKWAVKRGSFRLWRSRYGNVQQRLGTAGAIDFTGFTGIQYADMDLFPRTLSSVPMTGQTLPQALNFDWGNALDIVISSRHPTPFNLLGMILEIEIEGTSGAGT